VLLQTGLDRDLEVALERVRHWEAFFASSAAVLNWSAESPGTEPPTATLHDLRHTFGVHAAQAGVPIVRLQKLLGHATPHMTCGT
jgi:integrase